MVVGAIGGRGPQADETLNAAVIEVLVSTSELGWISEMDFILNFACIFGD